MLILPTLIGLTMYQLKFDPSIRRRNVIANTIEKVVLIHPTKASSREIAFALRHCCSKEKQQQAHQRTPHSSAAA